MLHSPNGANAAGSKQLYAWSLWHITPNLCIAPLRGRGEVQAEKPRLPIEGLFQKLCQDMACSCIISSTWIVIEASNKSIYLNPYICPTSSVFRGGLLHSPHPPLLELRLVWTRWGLLPCRTLALEQSPFRGPLDPYIFRTIFYTGLFIVCSPCAFYFLGLLP